MESKLYTILIQFINKKGEQAFVGQSESTTPRRALLDLLGTDKFKKTFLREDQRAIRGAVIKITAVTPVELVHNAWTGFSQHQDQYYAFTVIETAKR